MKNLPLVSKDSKRNILVLSLVCGAGCALAQAPLPAVLEIDANNIVTYQSDSADYSKLALSPTQVAGLASKNFSTFVGVADIIAVNGKPAKGTAAAWNATVNLSPTAGPGQMIADVTRGAIRIFYFEIQQADGTPVGSITAEGFSGGPGPPGGPLTLTSGSHVITGGTGAFLGVRGQFGSDASRNVAIPLASMTEDPANRRLRTGGASHWVLHLIPTFYPQIVSTANGPAVTHSNDFSLVTASKPASSGEILSLFVTGLGPTRPAVNPGQPFPASPLAVVNSPLEVSVNGTSAQVVGAVGFPGSVDAYQVNVQLPEGLTKGTATVQVRSAWIAGPSFSIAVQ